MFQRTCTLYPTQWRRTLLTLTVGLTAAVGCEQNARALKLDESKARDACQQFLTAWKDGKKPTDLAPAIVGKEADWDNGRKLASFEILPEERSDGANLFLKVKRTVITAKGTELNQEVGYVVGTSPVVTVFRSDQ